MTSTEELNNKDISPILTDRDKEAKDVKCDCKTCGKPIIKAEFNGYPFCFNCRSKYHKKKYAHKYQQCIKCGVDFLKEEGKTACGCCP